MIRAVTPLRVEVGCSRKSPAAPFPPRASGVEAQQFPSSGQRSSASLRLAATRTRAARYAANQVVFRLEVRVQRRLDGVRLLDDPLNPNGLNPFLIEEARRGIEKALAGAGFSVRLAAA